MVYGIMLKPVCNKVGLIFIESDLTTSNYYKKEPVTQTKASEVT